MANETIDLATFEFTGEELYHYGRKGMKWGQHIFGKTTGSVTSSKRKKKSKSLSSKLEARKKAKAAEKQREEATKKALSDTAKLKKKSLDEMTDDEIAKAIRRTQLENQYKQLNPEKESAGKRFVSTVFGQVIAPAAIASGERFLKNALDKYADGILADPKDNDSLASLKKEYEKLDYKNKIKKAKAQLDDDYVDYDNDPELKKLQNEQKKAEAKAKIEELKNPTKDQSKELAKLAQEAENMSKYVTNRDRLRDAEKRGSEFIENLVEAGLWTKSADTDSGSTEDD